jgi:hypothetical protein
MEDTFIVEGLANRRAALAGDIGRTQLRLKQMLLDLESLDAAIRVLDADYPIEKLKPKVLRPTGDWANRGEFGRLILDILRTASKPMSGLDIAREVMKFKLMDTSNKKALWSMRDRVGYVLRKRRKSGIVCSVQGPHLYVLWSLRTDPKLPPAANIPSIAC